MRLGTRAKLTIGIGVIAALGFAYLGLRELNGRAEARADVARQAGPDQPPPQALFAAATRAILTGETITADMIRSVSADPGRVPMAASPAEIVGKVATQDIAANSLVLRTALGQESSLAIRIPSGMRALSIDTTAEIAVAGLLRPGDRVDVQVVYPGADAISGARGSGRSEARTLLQMVPVLAVGDTVLGTRPASGAMGTSSTSSSASSSSSAPPAAVARTVTLALSPDQVSTLSLAKSTGALLLSLRNPADDAELQVAAQRSTGPLPVAPRAALAAVPPMLPQPARAAPAAPIRPRSAPQAIDLVVGGNREVIYSGSGSR